MPLNVNYYIITAINRSFFHQSFFIFHVNKKPQNVLKNVDECNVTALNVH